MSFLGSWQADIPSLNKGLAIVLLVLNINMPSMGTFLSACLGDKLRTTQLLVGLLQLLLFFCIIGWVWSIWWGILIFNKSRG